MESLDDIIIKRDSWTSMLELLKPYIAPQNWHMIGPAKEQWNAIPLQRQRQIWVTLWEQKIRGLKIKDHPYYAMKSFKMVSAKYFDRYGVYTLKAAQAFQLKDVKPLNYK